MRLEFIACKYTGFLGKTALEWEVFFHYGIYLMR